MPEMAGRSSGKPGTGDPSSVGEGISSPTDDDIGTDEPIASGPDACLLEVLDLCKVFKARGMPDKVALDGVSFYIQEGECLGLVGESGSGKSTTARIIARLDDATSGKVLLHGEDITDTHGRDLRHVYSSIQMVFQNPAGSFDPRRTLGDGVSESLRNAGMPRDEAMARSIELMGRCGLGPEFAGRYPWEASGGQCQRAAIARALAIGPSLLILDEATSALDVTVQQQVVELLRGIEDETGMSMLFISHDIALVSGFCNRMAVLESGKVVEEGRTQAVMDSPQSPYTQKLIDSIL